MRFVQSDNDLDFERIIQVPKRGIGEKRIDILKDYAKQNGSSFFEALKKCIWMSMFQNTKAHDFIETIEEAKRQKDSLPLSDFMDLIYTSSGLEDDLRQTGDDDRLENVAALKAAIQDMEDDSSEEITLEDYLNTIALYTNADENSKKDSVKLMTIHAAKGLEFPYVFVVSMNEGVMPSSKTRTAAELEEERRLAYVAFTRAEEELYITESEGFNLDGSFRYPSRFIFNTSLKNLKMLSNLKKELIDGAYNAIENHLRLIAQQENINSSILSAHDFKVGEKVSHRQYGIGIIVDNGDNGIVTVEFQSTSSQRTISITKLERLVAE
jgi:DNA helicase-2/ATP-dependent DNA helicase PcrA